MATMLQAGTIVGDEFQIQQRLGEGGMGVVFAATQLTTGHLRAVKVMHSPYVLDTKARARFEQEARIGARVPSDHVVQVVAAGVEEATHTPWLAMELLQGQDLERHIDSVGAMPLADVAFVVGQVGHALAAAHDVGVVHRDIKPENIFLSVSRVVGVPFMVKVLDFGIAKLRSSARVSTVAIGTPAYMSPEQTQSSDDIGPPADVWALALVVFRMLTGDFFWRAASEDAALPFLWRELLVDPVRSATERAAEIGLPDAIPPGFDTWFARCLKRNPAERTPDARAALQELEAVFASAGVASSSGPATTRGVLAQMTVEPITPDVARLSDYQASSVQPTLRSDPSDAPYRVSFREDGERVVSLVNRGSTLLEASLAAGIRHYHACGGKARCSTCRVVVVEGADNLGPRTAAEQTIAERKKWPETTRLACQASVQGPCTVRRLVVDQSDASLVDIRRTADDERTDAGPAVVLAVRLDGVDTVLAEGFPDDAVHVLERCAAALDELVTANGGRVLGLEGSTLMAAFAPTDDGIRRALRVALRSTARVRLLNASLLKHFGVQVDTAVGMGMGMLVEATTRTSRDKSCQLVIGAAIRDARAAVSQAANGEVLVASGMLAGVEMEQNERGGGLVQVVDFAKSDIVYLVQTTFDALGEQADDFAKAFYAELFAIHPAVAPMFEHTDMVRQRKMLVDTLAYAVRGLDDFAAIEQAVRELGQRHVGYGVTLKDYQFVGRALISTLSSTLGDDFTPEVELAWREIYSTLVRTMNTAA